MKTTKSSPVTTAIVTQAIAEDTAGAMLAAVRQESQARLALAARHLARYDYRAQAEDFHLWLSAPSAWSTVELASYLRTKGVGAVASVAFATDGNSPQAVRLCLGGLAGCLPASRSRHPGPSHAPSRHRGLSWCQPHRRWVPGVRPAR